MISFRDWMSQKVKEYYRSDFRKDFFTAPELDKAFGYTLADYMVQLIRHLPNPTLLELGGGSGALAYDILSYLKKKEPEVYQRVNYLIYDFSAELIELQRSRLRDFEEKVLWINSLPPIRGVIFSNEFFDCLPVHVIREGKELFIRGKEEVWAEISDPRIKSVLRRMGYEGLKQTVEVCLDCVDFLKVISESLVDGYHIVIDYGYLSHEISRFPHGTVVGYKAHRLYNRPEEGMDITAHVNFSLLQEYGREFGLREVFFGNLRDFLLSSPVFLEELEKLSFSQLPEDIERLSRLKTMLISMGERFRVLVQEKL